MTQTVKSDAQSAIEAMEKYHKAEIVTITRPAGGEDVPVLLVPEGMRPVETKNILDAFLTRPERITGTARFESLGSFIEYTKKFSTVHSKLFATEGKGSAKLPKPRLLAVYDHHHASETSNEAAFCAHRADYDFPLADEFVAWFGQNEAAMTQEAFATFLEDHLLDVVDPSMASEEEKRSAEQLGHKIALPGRLLDLSKKLEISVEHKVVQQFDPQTQQRKLVYSEAHKDGDGLALDVPGAFMIAVRVFESDEARTKILVRLRYKMQGQKAVWSFLLYQPERVFHDAFTALCDKASEQTGLPLFYGSPES